MKIKKLLITGLLLSIPVLGYCEHFPYSRKITNNSKVAWSIEIRSHVNSIEFKEGCRQGSTRTKCILGPSQHVRVIYKEPGVWYLNPTNKHHCDPVTVKFYGCKGHFSMYSNYQTKINDVHGDLFIYPNAQL